MSMSSPPWPTGAQLVAAERRRQVEIEGWTPDHDREEGSVRLYLAGWCYENARSHVGPPPPEWPWDAEHWKPKTRLRNLIRAGALYQAALDANAPEVAASANMANMRPEIDRVCASIDELLAEILDTITPWS